MTEELFVDDGLAEALEDAAFDPARDEALRAAGIERHLASLPLTRLHYLKHGDGPPLVIVPATISSIDSWIDLVRFMGRRYTVYFFELPGHGLSSPFGERFRSELVGDTVGHLLDAEGHASASLMGFSFGGILALQTLRHLRGRIDKVILLAPCATCRALTHRPAQVAAIRALSRVLSGARTQAAFLRLMHSRGGAKALARLAAVLGQVEHTDGLVAPLLALPPSTLDALVYQIREILTFDLDALQESFPQPLFFGMSVNDPLLDFDTTLSALEGSFAEVSVVRWDFPYHQPPEPFRFDQLNAEYADLLEMTCGTRGV